MEWSNRTIVHSFESVSFLLKYATHGISIRCLAVLSSWIEDRKDGFAGFRLRPRRGDEASPAAEVIFWDATGSFTVETFGEVPLEIIESLIAQAKQTVRTR
jgi:hypothetical protein